MMNRLQRFCLYPVIIALKPEVVRKSVCPRQKFVLWLGQNYYHSSSVMCGKKDLKATIEVAATLETDKHTKIKVFGIGDELMMVTTTFTAKEQAARDGLKLVELDPSAKPYPTYKFMSGKELYEFQMQQKQIQKPRRKIEKSIAMRTNISSHDIDFKVKQMKEWIHNGININLSIKSSYNLSDEEAASENSRMLKTVTDQVLDIAVVKQASQTGKDLSVILIPKTDLDQQSKGPTEEIESS